mgnify:CR=1 FL=1
MVGWGIVDAREEAVPVHVVVRRLAPVVAVPVGLIVSVAMEGTALVRFLVGFVAFGAVLWAGDLVWKAGASPEEVQADLEARRRDGD